MAKKTSGSEVLAAALIWLMTVVPLLLLEGWVISKIWIWHMVATFSLPAISVSQAIGLALAASILTHQNVKTKYEEDDGSGVLQRVIVSLLGSALRSLSYLGIAYLVLIFR